MTVETEQPTQTPEQVEQSANEAFGAGFSGVRGTEPPAAATPAEPAAPVTEEPPKTEASAATTATEQPVVEDEWAGVSPKVKAEIERLGAALSGVGKFSDRLRSIDGHIGSLTAASKEIKAALVQAKTATEGAGKEAPSQQQVASASESDALWKQLKEDFPDWAKAVESRLDAITAAMPKAAPPVDTAALKSEVTADVDKRIASASNDARVTARVYAYLDFKHGLDWEEKIKSQAFKEWFPTQPADTQALSASTKAGDASKLIGLFEQHLAKAAEKAARDKRLGRAEQPAGVAVTAAASGDAESAFAAGFKGVREGG